MQVSGRPAGKRTEQASVKPLVGRSWLNRGVMTMPCGAMYPKGSKKKKGNPAAKKKKKGGKGKMNNYPPKSKSGHRSY